MKIYGVVYLARKFFLSNKDVREEIIFELVNEESKISWKISNDIDIYPSINLTNQAIIMGWMSNIDRRLSETMLDGRIPVVSFYHAPFLQKGWITQALLILNIPIETASIIWRLACRYMGM